MESRFQLVFIILISLTAASVATAEDTFVTRDEIREALDPEIARRNIKEADIDAENFELGAYLGQISIEDFGSNTVTGIRFALHVTEDFFFEGTYGRSEGERTSFEELSGSSQLLTDAERKYQYYDLSLGYNIFPGEAFWAKNRTFNNAFYFVAGVGRTDFAGDEHFTMNLGAGYRILLNDLFAYHIDMRDHIFDSDLLGREKATHNLEFHTGITVFF